MSDPVTTSLGWAEETNKLVCTAVLPAGREGVQDQELSGKYYENAEPVVKLQVAKAGYRLARVSGQNLITCYSCFATSRNLCLYSLLKDFKDIC